MFKLIGKGIKLTLMVAGALYIHSCIMEEPLPHQKKDHVKRGIETRVQETYRPGEYVLSEADDSPYIRHDTLRETGISILELSAIDEDCSSLQECGLYEHDEKGVFGYQPQLGLNENGTDILSGRNDLFRCYLENTRGMYLDDITDGA